MKIAHRNREIWFHKILIFSCHANHSFIVSLHQKRLIWKRSATESHLTCWVCFDAGTLRNDWGDFKNWSATFRARRVLKYEELFVMQDDGKSLVTHPHGHLLSLIPSSEWTNDHHCTISFLFPEMKNSHFFSQRCVTSIKNRPAGWIHLHTSAPSLVQTSPCNGLFSFWCHSNDNSNRS